MKIRYQEILVNMERTQSVATIVVPEWEVPIVQAVHPATTVLKDKVVERDTVSISAEYSRLAQAYGAEREEGGKIGGPYVESVYGSGAIGVAALKRAMQGAVLPNATPVSPMEYAPALRQDLLQALSSDTLTGGDLIGALEEADEDALV